MLIPDVLAEVLHFFDRLYLTTLQLHGRGLRDIVDALCPKYPLASLRRVTIRVLPPGSAVVEMVNADYKRIETAALDFFDAVRDVNVLLQKSYVHRFELTKYSRELQDWHKRAPITKDQWNALVSAIQSATLEIIDLKRMDLTDVDANQLRRILDASCLEEVVLKWSRLRTTSISDAFLKLCRDNGVIRLMIYDNELVDGPSMSVTEEAIFDYCFHAEGRHRSNSMKLRLSIVHVSNSFLRRFLKTMEDSQSGRRYVCEFVGLNALPGPDEFRKYETYRSNTQVTFIIPFSHDSNESHILNCTCASV